MHVKPLHPAQRPALRAAYPAVWLLQRKGRNLRSEARALLRDLLAGYLGKAPDQVTLHFVEGQAPMVATNWQGMRLAISMSYSQDLALIALCAGAGIGVDVTEIATIPDWAQVAQLYLGPEAVARLAALDMASRDKMFALAWAELEARGKCLGLGLQEWSSARQQRLQQPSIEVSTGELRGFRSGLAYAVARDSTMWHPQRPDSFNKRIACSSSTCSNDR